MRYTIYASDRDAVEKKLVALGKRAEKFGVPFSFSFGEPHPQNVAIKEYDYVNHCLFTKQVVKVEAIDVEIESDGFIKMSGWTVLAKIEHGDKGNIVTPFGDAEVDNAWYSVEQRCDHCGTNRLRTVTFMVRHEDGRVRQVGKSCLKDYTGIDPALCALWASIEKLFADGMDCDESLWAERAPSRMYPVETILALAVEEIERDGYRRSEMINSTNDAVIDGLRNERRPGDKAREKAVKIINWMHERAAKAEADDILIKELDARRYAQDEYGQTYVADRDAEKERFAVVNSWDYVSDLERNCVPLIRSGYAKLKHVGRLSYLPVAFDRFIEKKAEAEKRAAAHADEVEASGYVGSVGERLTLKAASAKLVSSWDTMFGTTFLYRFTDEAGNVFIWKASGACDISDGMVVKGTVKDHSEYNGVKQTVLTRCKIA